MYQIGILGGSFNPVHLGHVNIARIAQDQFELDKVMFVPCKVSPFKTHDEPLRYITDYQRVKMIELALLDYPDFELSSLEINRGVVSYSFDTVKTISQMYKDARIFFIIGTDSLHTLSKWYKIHALLTLCDFVTVERPGVENISDIPGFNEIEIRRLTEHRVSGKLLDISSSDIRSKLAAGEPISGLVDPKVEEYITENLLYVSQH